MALRTNRDDLDELLSGAPTMAPRRPAGRPRAPRAEAAGAQNTRSMDLGSQSQENLPAALVTEAQLSDFLGCSSRQIRTLLSDGIITKAAKGLYDLRECTRAYCQRLVAVAARRQDSTLQQEKIRQTRAAADKIELQNKIAAGEYVAASDVRHTWEEMLTELRAGMLALPSRVGERLPALTTHDLETITLEVRDVLEELASGDA